MSRHHPRAHPMELPYPSEGRVQVPPIESCSCACYIIFLDVAFTPPPVQNRRPGWSRMSDPKSGIPSTIIVMYAKQTSCVLTWIQATFFHKHTLASPQVIAELRDMHAMMCYVGMPPCLTIDLHGCLVVPHNCDIARTPCFRAIPISLYKRSP